MTDGERNPAMLPDQFIAFADTLPEPHKWLIVTNNLMAKDAWGEMSHVWLTTFYTTGERSHDGLVTFDGDKRVVRLTHWKYA